MRRGQGFVASNPRRMDYQEKMSVLLTPWESGKLFSDGFEAALVFASVAACLMVFVWAVIAAIWADIVEFLLAVVVGRCAEGCVWV